MKNIHAALSWHSIEQERERERERAHCCQISERRYYEGEDKKFNLKHFSVVIIMPLCPFNAAAVDIKSKR
jgi:hypothetical protein